MGMSLPDDDAIHLVGIVAENVSTFSEALTPRVESAVEKACSTVRAHFPPEEKSICAEVA